MRIEILVDCIVYDTRLLVSANKSIKKELRERIL